MRYFKVRHCNEDKLLVEHKGVFTLIDKNNNIVNIIFDDINKDIIESSMLFQDYYIPGILNIPGGAMEKCFISILCELFTSLDGEMQYSLAEENFYNDYNVKWRHEMFFNEFGLQQEFVAVYRTFD